MRRTHWTPRLSMFSLSGIPGWTHHRRHTDPPRTRHEIHGSRPAPGRPRAELVPGTHDHPSSDRGPASLNAVDGRTPTCPRCMFPIGDHGDHWRCEVCAYEEPIVLGDPELDSLIAAHREQVQVFLRNRPAAGTSISDVGRREHEPRRNRRPPTAHARPHPDGARTARARAGTPLAECSRAADRIAASVTAGLCPRCGAALGPHQAPSRATEDRCIRICGEFGGSESTRHRGAGRVPDTDTRPESNETPRGRGGLRPSIRDRRRDGLD